MAKNTGVPYELLTKHIFRLILNEKRVKTIKVEHDVELEGITAKYKIDLYWEFEEGGIKYKTIVQAKDWSSPVKLEQLLTFKSILDDLPGQPRGVFVTSNNYQSGARGFAEKNGIILYELREPTEKDKAEWIKRFHIKVEAFPPHFENIKLEEDDEWTLSEMRRMKIPLDEAAAIKINLSDSTKIYDDNGVETTNLQDLLNSLVPKGLEELQPTSTIHTFDKPAFIKTHDARFQRMKIKAIKVLISKKLTTMEYQFEAEDFVGYILKNVIEKTERTIPKRLLEK